MEKKAENGNGFGFDRDMTNTNSGVQVLTRTTVISLDGVGILRSVSMGDSSPISLGVAPLVLK